MSTWTRRLVSAEDVGRSGLALSFKAGIAERKALARRLDLLALDALTAELRFALANDTAGAIRVSGTIDARVTQRCVVTLEPVPQTLRESIDALYVPLPADSSEREVDVPAEGETPEPLPADGIDVAEMVAEHLALCLDPYPRHPDAPAGRLAYTTHGDTTGGETDGGDALDDDGGERPFAVLGQLKSKL